MRSRSTDLHNNNYRNARSISSPLAEEGAPWSRVKVGCLPNNGERLNHSAEAAHYYRVPLFVSF